MFTFKPGPGEESVCVGIWAHNLTVQGGGASFQIFKLSLILRVWVEAWASSSQKRTNTVEFHRYNVKLPQRAYSY